VVGSLPFNSIRVEDEVTDGPVKQFKRELPLASGGVNDANALEGTGNIGPRVRELSWNQTQGP
jgi:hypothetical protein